MKKLSLLLAITFYTLSGYSQRKVDYTEFGIPVKNNAPFYELIDSVNAKGKSKEQIFDATRKAFADVFKDSKSVIEIENRPTGAITGKGSTNMTYKIGVMGITDNANIKFSINFTAKDSKYRIQLYDFGYRSSTESTYSSTESVFNLTKKYKTNFFTSFDLNLKSFLTAFSLVIIENLQESTSNF